MGTSFEDWASKLPRINTTVKTQGELAFKEDWAQHKAREREREKRSLGRVDHTSSASNKEPTTCQALPALSLHPKITHHPPNTLVHPTPPSLSLQPNITPHPCNIPIPHSNLPSLSLYPNACHHHHTSVHSISIPTLIHEHNLTPPRTLSRSPPVDRVGSPSKLSGLRPLKTTEEAPLQVSSDQDGDKQAPVHQPGQGQAGARPGGGEYGQVSYTSSSSLIFKRRIEELERESGAQRQVERDRREDEQVTRRNEWLNAYSLGVLDANTNAASVSSFQLKSQLKKGRQK